MKPVHRVHSGLFACALLAAPVVAAQVTPPQSGSADRIQADLVEYPAAYFGRYQPATALDMVRQVPGFLVDDGASLRGFGGAVGNVLINDKYPSAKLDSPSALLARIPANQVLKVELIRNQVRGIDMQGRPVLVNVVLKDDIPALVRWDVYSRFHSEGPAKPGIDLSVSDRWNNIDYNAGARIEREANGETGNDAVFDEDRMLLEKSTVEQFSTGIDLTGTLNASALVGRTFTQFNTRWHLEERNPYQVSIFTPVSAGIESREEIIDDHRVIHQFELGADAVRSLGEDLAGKAIFLFYRESVPQEISRSVFDASADLRSYRLANGKTAEMEGIARLELDWTGWSDHTVQFNAEGAYNELDSALVQTVDSGAGPVIVDVPGANILVEEVRGDFLLKDTWSRNPFEVVLGLGAEVSRISQSGDSDQERDFFFLKPEAVLSYMPAPGRQTRLRLAREVSQLNFNDFVSATVFEDDDLALGNPDLRPDTTWIAEASQEQRFGRETVVKLTAFHHWISGVLDLLPLTADFEAPGNIGDGRRWGLELDGTIPLAWLGLTGAKLDLNFLWQDSSVTDPVTGARRVLSGQGGPNAYRTLAGQNRNIGYFARVDYRQDFEQERVAWGWTVAERDERPLFKVNELDVRDEGYAIDAFVETTRWWDLKLSIVVQNMLNTAIVRDRALYAGRRGLSAVESYEVRDRYNLRRITLNISGTF